MPRFIANILARWKHREGRGWDHPRGDNSEIIASTNAQQQPANDLNDSSQEATRKTSLNEHNHGHSGVIQHPSSPYKYTPVDEAKHEIRLMTLLPGDFDSPIRVSLANKIFTKDCIADFEAISYTWGTPVDPVRIFVDDSELFVTQNLAEALPHLRYKDQSRVLWIDAVCVNQQDLEERSRQILRMADIFSKAARVVVWLGPEAEDSKIAMDCFEEIASHVNFDWISHTMEGASEDATWADRHTEFPFDDIEIAAIERFISRPWFERIWIWQEIRLASPSAIVQCGDHQIAWKSVRTAAGCLCYKASSVNSPRFISCRQTLLEICDVDSYVQFPDLLDMTKSAKATDPRDKIFALLSLLPENEVAYFNPIPDYQKSFEEVSRHTFIDYINSAASLRLLCSVEMHQHIQDLPSWVPDWSTAPIANRVSHINAGLWTTSSRFSTSSTILKVTGVLLARIRQNEAFKLTSNSNQNDARNDIKRVVDKMHIKSHCFQTSVSSKILSQTLCAGSFSESFVPPRKDLADSSSAEECVRNILRGIERNLPLGQFGLFCNVAAPRIIGRSLFYTEDGHIGLAPEAAEEGDVVMLLLGCNSLMVLRPVENAQYLVVGEAYMNGYMYGEALIGALPGSFEGGWKLDERRGIYIPIFIDRKNGKMQVEDPRLGELPPGWRIGSHEDEEYEQLFVHDESGKKTWKDPRLSYEELIKRGVKVGEFELI